VSESRENVLSGSRNAESGEFRVFAELARIGSATTSDVNALLAQACTLAVEHLALSRATIYRLLPSGEIVPVVNCGAGTLEPVGGLVWTLDDRPLFRRAWEERSPVVVEGTGEDPALPKELLTRTLGGERRTVILASLCGRETCLGFIAGEDGVFTAAQVAKFGAFADLLAAFLEQGLEQERLHRLDDLKSHFIALASHELRAPVSVIHGLGVTLNARREMLDADAVARMHTMLNEQTEHLAQLVNQLLDLSRLEANAIKLEKREIRVRERIEEIVSNVVGDQADAIEVDVPESLATLVDPSAFERIVSNLITNAFRYGAPPITIAAQQRDTHFRLVVEDRGDGVPKQFVPRLFERFTRSDESAPRTTGSGLGLAIAQSYANAHGGELMYEPAEPKGARFELVLPRPHPGEQ
jgi:signal transduction histidine kinase